MSRTNFIRPTASLLVILSIIGRFLPHPPNFVPVGATALFSGAKLSRPWNYLVPLLIMLATDLVIGLHGTMLYVYASFLVMTLLGERFLNKKSETHRVAAFSLLGSIIFFVVTNFGVWAEGLLYPPTIEGLIACYVAALPFLGNTVMADLVFGVGFFAIYQWAENRSLVTKIDNRVAGWLVK